MIFEETERLKLEQMGFSREDVNNAMFSVADIADMYSIDPNDIHILNYSNQDFYAAEITQKQEMLGFNFSVKSTVLVCIRNGYIYSFQFSGASDSSAYIRLFDEMMTSIVW